MSAMRATISAGERREMEQQELLERLSRSAFEAAEKFFEEDGDAPDANRFYMLAAHDIFERMISAHGGAYCHHMGNGASELTFVGSWVRRTAEDIEKFSRAPEEANDIKLRLMLSLVECGTSHIRNAYSELRSRRPVVLYGGHRAADEVDIPVLHETALAGSGEEHF